MKKALILILTLVVSFALVGCQSDPVVDEEKAYFTAGQFNDWGEAVGTDAAEMEAITDINDERIASIKDQLEDVKYVYVNEITLPSDDAGWTMNYIIDDTNTTLNGNLAVKIVRTDIDDAELIDWWAQAPESGEIDNLTPDTLFVTPFVETAEDTIIDPGEDGEEGTEDDITFTTGAWNDNPAALEAGTYTAVFAEFEDGTRAMGLIPVE